MILSKWTIYLTVIRDEIKRFSTNDIPYPSKHWSAATLGQEDSKGPKLLN